MIISASRRTDIPAYYFDWFLNRLEAGYVLVRNARNPELLSKISLKPDVVDGVVFWTKNPVPILKKLDRMGDLPYYVQFTLTPYGPDVETRLPDKERVLVPAFLELAEKIGPNRVIWRYDPIFFTGRYTLSYHLEQFRKLAEKLKGSTDTCTVSFLDRYPSIEGRIYRAGIQSVTKREAQLLLEQMQETAAFHGMNLVTCAETGDFCVPGLKKGSCIDPKRIERQNRIALSAKKDPGQREGCGCAESVDIGMYNCCRNGCVYCYANHDASLCRKNYAGHDPHSPLLYGTIGPNDRILERTMQSQKKRQLRLFD